MFDRGRTRWLFQMPGGGRGADQMPQNQGNAIPLWKLSNELISRAAGAAHGQELAPEAAPPLTERMQPTDLRFLRAAGTTGAGPTDDGDLVSRVEAS